MIYTAVSGQRDNIRKDVKCFTAYNRFASPRMNAKIYKVLPHLFLNTQYSIWIDANLHLKVDEPELIRLLGDKEIAVFRHPYRDNVYKEAEECIKLKLDDPAVIARQMYDYKAQRIKGDNLGACYLIIREHTERIKRLNEQWWAEICRYSSRDQLSFNKVFQDVQLLPKTDPFNNQYFKRVGHLN